MALTLNVNVTINRPLLCSGSQEAAIMEALTNLTTSIDRLTAAVDRIANAGGVGGGVPEADVQAAADRVTEQAQRLEAIPTPSDAPPASTAPARK